MWSSSSSSLLVLQQPSTLLLLSASSSGGEGGPRKAQWVCRPYSLKNRVNRMKQMRQFTVSAQLDLKSPPYHLDALEPHMSHQTFEYHWGKHHRSYVENLNKQILETELDQMSLEDIVIKTYNKGDLLPEFNNAAQAWNHEFFWESMKPGGGGSPSGILLEFIERDFGSFETFLKEFKAAALTQFGSGWAWLSYKANRIDVENAVNPRPTEKDKKLVISKSPNAMNPLVWDYTPLLTIDVWEHAYYLDYQNQRPNYVSVFMEKLVSWETVSARLDMAIEKEIRRVREEERKKREEEERKRREEEERKQRKQGKERIEAKKEEETQWKETSEGEKEEEEMQ